MFFLRRRLENKEYLGISDREWYSKRYYKKLVKSGVVGYGQSVRIIK